MKKAKVESATVLLPSEVVKEIDRIGENRSRFVLEAVRHELERRRRSDLRRSLRSPHPETSAFAALAAADWTTGPADEDLAGLVDTSAGQPIRWTREGWVRAER
jgi:hypothetical protein